MHDLRPDVLCVTFRDGRRVEFSPAQVRTFATEFLDSAEHVPDSVRRAAEFQRCSICPHAGEPGYCHALFPSLTVLASFDRYPSYEPVEVSYWDPALDGSTSKKTSLQKAMHGVSILSLTEYCEFGRRYRDLFLHVNPLMKLAAVASRIYLNAFWLSGGDPVATAECLKGLTDGLQVTIRCQLKRLRLICKSDSFQNAFASTHVLADLLETNLRGALDESLAQHRQRSDAATCSAGTSALAPVPGGPA